MKQYLDGLLYIEENGVTRADRTGKGRHGVFSPPDERYNMADGFPLVTTRAINPLALIHELDFFIKGESNIKDLKYSFFWKRWATTEDDVKKFEATYERKAKAKPGSIGMLYGPAWRKGPGPANAGSLTLPRRSFVQDFPSDLLKKYASSIVFDGKPVFESYQGFAKWLDTELQPTDHMYKLHGKLAQALLDEYWSTFDQLNELVVNLKQRPFSSRLRVTAMLPQFTAFEEFSSQDNTLAGRGALTPCHAFFQCYVTPGEEGTKNKLSLKLYMTSNDYPVGRVYNIAQYSLLLCMLAHVTDLEAHEFIISTGDGHIYSDQRELVREQIAREPQPLPKLWLNPNVKSLFDFTPSDIEIRDYNPLTAIAYPVAI